MTYDIVPANRIFTLKMSSQIKITNQVKKVVHSERKAADINTREKL